MEVKFGFALGLDDEKDGDDDTDGFAPGLAKVEITYEGGGGGGFSFKLSGEASLTGKGLGGVAGGTAGGNASGKNNGTQSEDATAAADAQLCVGARLSGELTLAVDPSKGASQRGEGDVPSPGTFAVNATGYCGGGGDENEIVVDDVDDDGDSAVRTLRIDADVAGWQIVDNVFEVASGTARVVLRRRENEPGLGNVTGAVSASLRIGSGGAATSASADGVPPIFNGDVTLTSDFTVVGSTGDVSVQNFAVSGRIAIVTGIPPPDDSSSSSSSDGGVSPYVAVTGEAEMVYPCRRGDTITAAVGLTANAGAGNFNADDLKATLVYHCGVGMASDSAGSESVMPPPGVRVPVFEIAAATAGKGGVTFVKGLTLDEFGLNFTAFRSWKGKNGTVYTTTPRSAAAGGGDGAVPSARDVSEGMADSRLFGRGVHSHPPTVDPQPEPVWSVCITPHQTNFRTVQTTDVYTPHKSSAF